MNIAIKDTPTASRTRSGKINLGAGSFLTLRVHHRVEWRLLGDRHYDGIRCYSSTSDMSCVGHTSRLTQVRPIIHTTHYDDALPEVARYIADFPDDHAEEEAKQLIRERE